MEWIALGSLIVSGASFLWNAISGGQQQDIQQESLDLEKTNAYQSSLSNLTTMQNEQENIKNQIIADEGTMSEYDEFLERYPAYAEYQTSSALAEGKASYKELASNYALSEVSAAARGQTGSTTIAAKQNDADIISQYGTDKVADAYGGLFGQQMEQLTLDLEATKTEAERNKEILGTSLDSLKTTLETYDATISTQQGIVDTLKKEAGL